MNEFLLAIAMFLSVMGTSVPAEQSATYVNVPNYTAYLWEMTEPQSSPDNMMLAQAFASSISWSDYDSQEYKLSWDEGWEQFGWLEGSTITLKKKDNGVYAKLHLVQKTESKSYRDLTEKVEALLGEGFELETSSKSSSSVTSDFEIKLF